MASKLNGDPCACADHCCEVEHQAQDANDTAIEKGELTLAQAVQSFVAKCNGATAGGPCSSVEGAYHAGQEHGCPKAADCALKINNSGRQTSSKKPLGRKFKVV